MNANETRKQALSHYQSGNLQEAARLFHESLEKQPNNAEILYLLAIIYGQLGKYDLSIQYFKRHLQLNPSNAEAYFALGIAVRQKGLADEAIEHFQKSLSLNQGNSDVRTALGNALAEKGNYFKEREQFDEAIVNYQRAIEVEPGRADADILYHNLGMSFQAKGMIDEAIGCYRKAVEINPDLLVSHNNLGIVLQKKGLFEEAFACYQKALLISPDSAETYYNLGVLLQGQGKNDEATAAYNAAIRIRPGYIAARWAKCICQLPVIYPDPSSIKASRERYSEELAELSGSILLVTPEDVRAAVGAVGTQQPFHLAYQGLNDRDLQQLYGNLVCKIMSAGYPQFSVTKETTNEIPSPLPSPARGEGKIIPLINSPSGPPLKLRGGRRSYEDRGGREGLRGDWGTLSPPLRVGIVSGFFHSHPVWKIIAKGWAENFEKTKICPFGYYTGRIRDKETENAMQCFERFVGNIYSFSGLCDAIVNDKLHAIIYPEIGMDPVTVRLAALRLAPVQCVSWGHPETSGLPTIDYFLSGDLMEPPDGNDAYTEQLVRLPNLSIYYRPSHFPGIDIDRDALGLRPGSVLYHCCQTVFKYLPQYDDIFPRIARRVVDCQFLFSSLPGISTIIEQFRTRIYQAFARFNLNADDYAVFLPHLDQVKYNALNNVCDVFLDPIGWSGCTSTLEALDCNLPVVAFPGPLMRGRESSAILTMMGVRETIAASLEDYVEIAIKLGQDSGLRRLISEKIDRNKHKIYGDRSCITGLEDFLIRAVKDRLK